MPQETAPQETVPHETVIAVVVTYNRPDKLRQCVEALLASETELHRIVIIDNASDRETIHVIESFPPERVDHVRLASNLGGAGGFNRGVRHAHLLGADYVWLMDDDAFPKPASLSALLRGIDGFREAAGDEPSFACSVVEWTDGTLCLQNAPVLTGDAPRYTTPDLPVLLTKSCSFVSVLVPRWAIAEVGLPIADFFLWYDDSEYTQRLNQVGPGIYCLDSRVVHDTATNEDINFGRARGSERWKYELGLRNQTAWTRRNRGVAEVIELVVRRRREMLAADVPVRDRLAIYRSWLHGLIFRYAVEPAPSDPHR